MSQRHESANAGRAEIDPSGIDDSVPTLSRIFIEHDGYVSDKWEQYLPAYEAVLRGFVEPGKPVRLLEIGVQNGGSLQIWSKYLPRGSIIVGIDINPACAGFLPETNISILIGDAGDKVALDRMLGDAKFDIIIDDGSHRSDHVIAAFNACFGRLNFGGLYIVEDLHCSYHSSHGGGFRLARSSMEWFKGLSDALNADHFEPDASDELDGVELQRLGKLGREIARITFFDSLVVVEKLTSEKRRPYRRMVTGRNAHVADVVSPIALIPNALRNLLLSPSAAAAFTPKLLEKLASAIEEVGRLRAMLAQAAVRHESEMHAASADIQQRIAEAAERDAEIARLHDALSARDLELSSVKAERDAEIARQAEKDALLNQAERIICDVSERYAKILQKSSFRKLRYALKLALLRFPVRTSQYNLIRNSAFFDHDFYLNSNPDVKAAKFDAAVHYLQFGCQEGRDPGPQFSETEYRALSPDVATSSLSALEHYESRGRNERRRLLALGPSDRSAPATPAASADRAFKISENGGAA